MRIEKQTAVKALIFTKGSICSGNTFASPNTPSREKRRNEMKAKRFVSKVAALAVAMVMALCVIPVTVKAADLIQLEPPTNLQWGEDWGKNCAIPVSWDEPDLTEEIYWIQFMKDGNLVYEIELPLEADVDGRVYFGSGLPYMETVMEHNFESGNYTFRVRNIGDGVETAGSAWSEESPVHTYTKPSAVFNPPTNLRWEGLGPMWDAPAAVNGVTPEYYFIDLLRDGIQRESTLISQWDLPVNLGGFGFAEFDGLGTYTFRVRTVSNDINAIADSEYSVLSPEYVNTEGELVLDTPTNPRWGDNWGESLYLTAVWDEVPKSGGEYSIQVFRDGQFLYYENCTNLFGDGNGVVSYDLYIPWVAGENTNLESGRYTFNVRAWGDNINNVSSQWSVRSAEHNYTKPSAAFSPPSNLRWEGLLPAWDAAASVNGESPVLYIFEFFKDGTWIDAMLVHNDLSPLDLSGYYFFSSDTPKVGTYTFRLRTISNNINTVANGEYSALSPEYVHTQDGWTEPPVTNQLQEIINNETLSTEEKIEAVKNINKGNLATVMQDGGASLSFIQELEAANNATVNLDVDDYSAQRLSGPIDIVGAGLNTTSGSSISVVISQPDAEVVVNPAQYDNWVQFSIELVGENVNPDNLDVPVTITMPIPSGMSPSRLTILHHHGDGSYETLTSPHGFRYNGDGTVTFTVTRFSTFVFAERAEAVAPIPAPYRPSTPSSSTSKPSNAPVPPSRPESSAPAYRVSVEPGTGGAATVKENGIIPNNQKIPFTPSYFDIKNAVSAAKKGAGDNGEVIINIDITARKNMDDLAVRMVRSSMNLLQKANAALHIYSEGFKAEYDSDAVKELYAKSRTVLVFSAKPVELTGDAKAVIGNRPVFEFSVKDIKGNVVMLEPETVTYSIPYTPGRNETPDNLGIAQIVNGEVVWIDSVYKDGWFTWTGDANGIYGVGVSE
jgi:hypothetical protein